MKVLLIALSLFCVGQYVFVTSDAAKVTWPTSHTSIPEIHMQVSVRNANGDLIAYFEPTLWYIADIDGLHDSLDTKAKKSLLHKGGKQYEKIKFVETFVIYDTRQVTSEPIYYNGREVLMPRHDGIIAEPGYQIDVSWNILRLVR